MNTCITNLNLAVLKYNFYLVLDRVSFNQNGTLGSKSLHVKSTCPHTSAVGWAILIQYLLLVFFTVFLLILKRDRDHRVHEHKNDHQ